jgi:acyl-coenzyme A thioesterase PaaI-like protein
MNEKWFEFGGRDNGVVLECNTTKHPKSQSLPIYLPNIQHPRPLARREAGVTCVGRVVHVVVDGIGAAVALWAVRVWPSGAVIACRDPAVGTGVFACGTASCGESRC